MPAGFRFSVKAPRTDNPRSKTELQFGGLISISSANRISSRKARILSTDPSYHRVSNFITPARESSSRCFVGAFQETLYANHAMLAGSGTQSDNLLKEFHIARAAVDPAGVPDSTQPGGLASLASYFRLHGSPPQILLCVPR